MRASGNVPIRSSSNGIGSLPWTLAFDTSDHGRSLILPGTPHVRCKSLS